MSTLDKVNVLRIVVDHIGTLRDYSTKKYRFSDFLLFFGVPLAIAGALVYSYGSLQPNLISIVATSLSIFAALLFNLLLLVYDVTEKSKGYREHSNGLRQRFLGEVFCNISFAILVAIGAIVSVLILVLANCSFLAARVLSFIIFYLVTLFLLTLLMLLKRVHVLLRHQTTST